MVRHRRHAPTQRSLHARGRTDEWDKIYLIRLSVVSTYGTPPTRHRTATLCLLHRHRHRISHIPFPQCNPAATSPPALVLWGIVGIVVGIGSDTTISSSSSSLEPLASLDHGRRRYRPVLAKDLLRRHCYDEPARFRCLFIASPRPPTTTSHPHQ